MVSEIRERAKSEIMWRKIGADFLKNSFLALLSPIWIPFGLLLALKYDDKDAEIALEDNSILAMILSVILSLPIILISAPGLMIFLAKLDETPSYDHHHYPPPPSFEKERSRVTNVLLVILETTCVVMTGFFLLLFYMLLLPISVFCSPLFAGVARKAQNRYRNEQLADLLKNSNGKNKTDCLRLIEFFVACSMGTREDFIKMMLNSCDQEDLDLITYWGLLSGKGERSFFESNIANHVFSIRRDDRMESFIERYKDPRLAGEVAAYFTDGIEVLFDWLKEWDNNEISLAFRHYAECAQIDVDAIEIVGGRSVSVERQMEIFSKAFVMDKALLWGGFEKRELFSSSESGTERRKKRI